MSFTLAVEPDSAPVVAVTGHVTPHLRGSYVRTINGRAVPVRPTIVNSHLARQQLRYGALAQALRLARQAQTVTSSSGSEGGLCREVRDQRDLVEELDAVMKRRGEEILSERLENYQRLTTTECGHLAMARIRVVIDRLACDAHRELGTTSPVPSVCCPGEELDRLESLLFVASLQRLDEFEARGVRAAFAARVAKRPAAAASPLQPASAAS